MHFASVRFDPAAAYGRLFVVLTGRQGGQGVGEVFFFLLLGHPAPRSQSLQVRRLIGLSSPVAVAGKILSVRRPLPQL
jgi:hypothetical protein